MEQLTQDVMRRAIQKCVSNPYYRVAIPCEHTGLLPVVNDMFKEEKDFLWYDNYIHRIRTTAIEFVVQFINGSQIRAFRVSQSSRGVKANEVDFYGRFENEMLYTIFAPMEIEYDIERNRCFKKS